jgi:hypothetical protein
MAKYRLTPGGLKLIEDEIDKMFDAAKVRYLGPHTVDKRIYVTYERPKALAGIYEAAASLSGGTPDTHVLNTLIRVAGNYLDGARSRAKSRIVADIQAKLAEAEAQGGLEASEVTGVLKESIIDTLKDATFQVKQIIEAQTNGAKNISIYDSIVGINKAVGVTMQACILLSYTTKPFVTSASAFTF